MTMTTNDLFAETPKRGDAASAAKERGMALAASSQRGILALVQMRAIAERIAMQRDDRTCSSDDVRFYCEMNGIPFEPGNWMGSLFRNGKWEATDRRVKAMHKRGHAREIRVWKLRS